MLALLCAVTVNCHRGKGKAAKPEDFLPRWGQSSRLDPIKQYKMLLMQARMHNAAVERKRGRT